MNRMCVCVSGNLSLRLIFLFKNTLIIKKTWQAGLRNHHVPYFPNNLICLFLVQKSFNFCFIFYNRMCFMQSCAQSIFKYDRACLR